MSIEVASMYNTTESSVARQKIAKLTGRQDQDDNGILDAILSAVFAELQVRKIPDVKPADANPTEDQWQKPPAYNQKKYEENIRQQNQSLSDSVAPVPDTTQKSLPLESS